MTVGGKGTFLSASQERGASRGRPLRDFVSPKSSEDTEAWYLTPRIRNPGVKKLRLSGQHQDKKVGTTLECSRSYTSTDGGQRV